MDNPKNVNVITTFCRRHLTATIAMLATFTLLMVFTVVAFWFTVTSALNNYLTQQTEVLGSSLATQASFNATQSILNNDLLSLNVLLTRLVIDDNILSARVYNKQDELLAEASSDHSMSYNSGAEIRPNEDRRVYSSSVKFRNEIVGHVLITLDRTPSQNTLNHLNNLLISVAIFICALAFVVVFLLSRWLFNPIIRTTEVLEALSHKHNDAILPDASYREALELIASTKAVQAIDWRTEEPAEANIEIVVNPEAAPQLEMDFDKLFTEQKMRSCALFFEISHLEAWQQNMPPLQVANLLTPIYRALFHSSEIFLGQVHQYQGNSAVIFYRAQDCEDSLYTNAVCTAQLFLGLIEQLMSSELYHAAPKIDFHFGLHQGNSQILDMMENDLLDATKIPTLLHDMQQLSQSSHKNSLLLSEEVFTLPDIQNKVFTGLPEIVQPDNTDDEIMAYSVKGVAEKLNLIIQSHIISIGDIPTSQAEAQQDATEGKLDAVDDLLNIVASKH